MQAAPRLFDHLSFDAGEIRQHELACWPGVKVQIRSLAPAELRAAEERAGEAPLLGEIEYQRINRAHIDDLEALAKKLRAADTAEKAAEVEAEAERLAQGGRARRLMALYDEHATAATHVERKLQYEHRRAYEIVCAGLVDVEGIDFSEIGARGFLSAFKTDETSEAMRRSVISELAQAIEGGISPLGKARSARPSGARTASGRAGPAIGAGPT